jgi:hypothetical protein
MTGVTNPHEQLSLLPNDDLPVQSRLDDRTRRIGLAGIAQARKLLDRAHDERVEREAAEQAQRAAERRPHRDATVPHVEPPQAA